MLYTGEVRVDKREEVGKAWANWKMNRVLGFEVHDGLMVSKDQVKKSILDLVGLDIVEASTPEEAVETAKKCPGLPYGLSVQVWKELEE